MACASGESSNVTELACLTIGSIGRHERSRCPAGPLGGRFAPAGEVGHALELGQPDRGPQPHAGDDGIQKTAQNPRVVEHELRPEILFAPAVRRRDRTKLEEDAAVDHVGAPHDIVDAGQDDGSMGLQTTSSWFVKSPRVEMPPPVTSRQRPFESQSGMALKLSYA